MMDFLVIGIILQNISKRNTNKRMGANIPQHDDTLLGPNLKRNKTTIKLLKLTNLSVKI